MYYDSLFWRYIQVFRVPPIRRWNDHISHHKTEFLLILRAVFSALRAYALSSQSKVISGLVFILGIMPLVLNYYVSMCYLFERSNSHRLVRVTSTMLTSIMIRSWGVLRMWMWQQAPVICESILNSFQTGWLTITQRSEYILQVSLMSQTVTNSQCRNYCDLQLPHSLWHKCCMFDMACGIQVSWFTSYITFFGGCHVQKWCVNYVWYTLCRSKYLSGTVYFS